MAFAYKDRVKETTTTTGTGTITLAGAVTGFRTFQSAFSTSDTMYYVIDGGAGEWEVGLGTLATTTTLARTTVLSSSNAGSAVNFSAGTKNVWCDVPASALIASGMTLSAAGAITALSVAEAVGTSAITVTGATQTTSKPVLDLSQTWNSIGTTFTGLKLNVTDTNSASTSLLMDLQVGGTSKGSLSKSGIMSIADVLQFSGNTSATPTRGIGSLSTADVSVYTSGARNFAFSGTTFYMQGGQLQNASNTASFMLGAAQDVVIARDAANTLALRNGTSAQTFNWYFSYTDASNYARGALKTASAYVEMAAETAGTGADNINVKLTPAGTGTVQFGTHSAIAAETVTGYITITDAGGTTRKLAVVS